MEKSVSTGGVSGLTLKMIAIATMLIDHIAAVVIRDMYSFVDSDGVYVFYNEFAYDVYSIMCLIGRMPFPLFSTDTKTFASEFEILKRIYPPSGVNLTAFSTRLKMT